MSPNLILGLFSIVLSCLYSLSAWTLPDSPIGNPMAPKYFPIALGVVGLLLGVALLTRGVNRHGDREKIHFYRLRLNFVIILVSAIYIMIFEKIGFIGSTVFFLLSLLSLINGLNKWKVNSAVTVCFTLSIWYVFERVFYISLP